MDARNAQVGWTEAQWNRVHEEVRREWDRVRVAGSFLPVYGPLPRSTQVVPSEILRLDGTVDDGATARLVEIAFPVSLSGQQLAEDDLSSAILAFRRASARLGQLEDWLIFNGYQPSEAPEGEKGAELAALDRDKVEKQMAEYIHAPGNLGVNAEEARRFINGGEQPTWPIWRQRLIAQLGETNPGALGLLASGPDGSPAAPPLTIDALINGIVDGVSQLEANRYVAPFVCILGREPFRTAAAPVPNAGLVAPRDRLEPLIGRELLHSAAIDIPPLDAPDAVRQAWPRRGVVLSLAGDPIDVAIAVEATPQFTHVTEDGRYMFRVVERFALRIKDPRAIVALAFGAPPGGGGGGGAGGTGPGGRRPAAA